MTSNNPTLFSLNELHCVDVCVVPLLTWWNSGLCVMGTPSEVRHLPSTMSSGASSLQQLQPLETSLDTATLLSTILCAQHRKPSLNCPKHVLASALTTQTHSRFGLTLLLPWCSCIRCGPGRSHISPPDSPLPLGHSNAATAATWVGWTKHTFLQTDRRHKVQIIGSIKKKTTT